MIRTIRTLALLALAPGLACVAVSAEQAATPTASRPPLTQEEVSTAMRTDLLSIPTPGELLAAIDKLGKPDWASAIRAPISRDYSSRPQLAINIGGLIADGYIAVEAANAQQVKNIGKDLTALAKSLGFEQDVLNRGRSLTDFADRGQWDTLKEEFEATQNEVKSAMRGSSDSDLVTLVTLGGWLRGMEAMADYISQHYTPEAAKLLRQPGVIHFLNERLADLPDKVRDDPSVKKARSGLTNMEQALTYGANAAPPKEVVDGLKMLSTDLLKELARKK